MNRNKFETGSTYYYFLLTGNMLGAVKGAGIRIARQYSKAVPLWCTTHQLNRVIVQSCTEPAIRNMTGTVDNFSIFPLYLYLSFREFIFEKMVSFIIFYIVRYFEYFAKRSFVYTEVIERSEEKKKKWKQLCRTRWVERIASYENF